VAILGSWDLNEVAIGEFGFSSGNDLRVLSYPIVFGCVFSVNLAHYE